MRDFSFSTVWDGYPTDEAALAARDAKYCELRSEQPDRRLKRWTLRDQLRPYASFGVPDGRVCNVYKISEV